MTDEHSPPPQEQVPTDNSVAADEDPLKKVAGAMMTAAEAVRAGAGDASAAAAKFLPAAGRAVSKTVYTSCYYLSYGVVFPTMLAVSVLPKNNPVYYGLVDGGRAAQDSVHRLHQRRAALKSAAQDAIDQAATGYAPA